MLTTYCPWATCSCTLSSTAPLSFILPTTFPFPTTSPPVSLYPPLSTPPVTLPYSHFFSIALLCLLSSSIFLSSTLLSAIFVSSTIPPPSRPFLGATKHLYNWLCPLVGRSVCLSVCLSVCKAFVRRSTRRTLLAYLALFLHSPLLRNVFFLFSLLQTSCLHSPQPPSIPATFFSSSCDFFVLYAAGDRILFVNAENSKQDKIFGDLRQ